MAQGQKGEENILKQKLYVELMVYKAKKMLILKVIFQTNERLLLLSDCLPQRTYQVMRSILVEANQLHK